MTVLKVEWDDAGREAECLLDPAHPGGIDLVDNPEARAHCITLLPYPAPRCGGWLVSCDRCRKRTYITAAGRPDDPRSVAIACAVSILAMEADHGKA